MNRDDILKFIRMKGPILPIQLASLLKKDTIITGAMLSELVSSRLILISNTKVGGSPVYYLKEQAFKLQELYRHLNEKDRKAYDLLKKEKLLRDVKLSPLLRVALRNIKDFSKPIEVTIGSTKEIFWRWYMITPEQASAMLKEMFRPKNPIKSIKPIKPIKPEPIQQKSAVSKPKTNDSKSRFSGSELKPQETELKSLKSMGRETKIYESGQKQSGTETKIQKPSGQQVLTVKEPINDILYDKTKKYFNSKGIEVLELEIVRRKSEIDYVLSIPSAVGNIKYYCKAKSKKRCNDTDLAGVFVNAQLKKLPGLFLMLGELTKKAREKLGNEFDTLKVKKI